MCSTHSAPEVRLSPPPPPAALPSVAAHAEGEAYGDEEEIECPLTISDDWGSGCILRGGPFNAPAHATGNTVTWSLEFTRLVSKSKKWKISFTLQQAVEEIWNATVESEEDDGNGTYRIRLSPAHYNHVLTPGQEADWGCKLSAGGLPAADGR